MTTPTNTPITVDTLITPPPYTPQDTPMTAQYIEQQQQQLQQQAIDGNHTAKQLLNDRDYKTNINTLITLLHHLETLNWWQPPPLDITPDHPHYQYWTQMLTQGINTLNKTPDNQQNTTPTKHNK